MRPGSCPSPMPGSGSRSGGLITTSSDRTPPSGGEERVDLSAELLPLTVPEIRHLLACLIGLPPREPCAVIAWSIWRRRHQQRARKCHRQRRTQTDKIPAVALECQWESQLETANGVQERFSELQPSLPHGFAIDWRPWPAVYRLTASAFLRRYGEMVGGLPAEAQPPAEVSRIAVLEL